MTSQILWIALALYLTIGIYVATLGPLSRDLRADFAKIRYVRPREPMMTFDPEYKRVPIPRWHRLAIAVTLGAGALVGWPIFIRSAMRLQRAERDDPEPVPVAAGLRSAQLGGEGDIYCRSCKHKERFTSCVHGFPPDDWWEIGYQCRRCRMLTSVKSYSS